MVEITPRTLWDSFALTYVYGRRRETPAMFPLFVAAYLPFSDGEIDWPGFQRVIARIYAAGAVPVVNADTGWAFLLTSEQKREVVRRVREWHPDKEIVVGVTPGANASTFDVRAYSAAVAEVKLDDRVRIMVMVSEGLLALRDDELVSAYGAIDGLGEGAIVHELTEEFVPFGRELSPYELHGVLRLPAFTAVKTSALSGPAILRRTVMCEQGGLRRGGKSVQVLSGVDWKVREAFEFADGILMGAAVLFPQLFARLVDLRREADDARTRAERWRYEDLVTAVQSAVSFQFLPRGDERPDVGAYRHLTAMWLRYVDVIDAAELPKGVRSEHMREVEEVGLIDRYINMLERVITSVGEDPKRLLA